MTLKLTPRLLSLIDSSSHCAKMVVIATGDGDIDISDAQAILTRLSIIDGRSMLLLACLNVEDIEADFDAISISDEVEFMVAAEEFIKEIERTLEEAK